MLPQGGELTNSTIKFEEDLNQTQTFSINLYKHIVGGKIDGLEALKQTMYLLLNTEADQFIIYPYTYGLTTIDLIGMPSDYVIAVLPLRIKDALMSDDRITGVQDFEFEIVRNKLNVKFVVKTIYGNFEGEKAVVF